MKVLIALMLALSAHAAPQLETAVEPRKAKVEVVKSKSSCSCKCMTGGMWTNLSPANQLRLIKKILDEVPQPEVEVRLD